MIFLGLMVGGRNEVCGDEVEKRRKVYGVGVGVAVVTHALLELETD